MSTTTGADVSLLDDSEFIEELERLDQADADALDAVLDRRMFADAFVAVETRLPASQSERPLKVPQRERSPIGDPYDAPVVRPASAEIRIPFMAAAIVLMACLSAGAATAAFVFHDRVTQITALPPATR